MNKDFPIFDCDSHVVEPPEIWDEYVPSDRRAWVKTQFDFHTDTDQLRINGRVVPATRERSNAAEVGWPRWNKKAVGALVPGTEPWKQQFGRLAGCRDPHARLRDMDAIGTDQVMLFPTWFVRLALVRGDGGHELAGEAVVTYVGREAGRVGVPAPAHVVRVDDRNPTPRVVERRDERGLAVSERREQRVAVLVAEVVDDVDEQQCVVHPTTGRGGGRSTRSAARARSAGDVSAPGSRLDAAALDQVAEALEVALDPPLVEPERGPGLLLHAVRLPVHLHGDTRGGVVDPVERDDSGVRPAVRRLPGHALVRVLLGDLGVPLPPRAADLSDPVKVRVVQLADVLDALHERRELLELRPLVVRDGDRDVNVDRALYRCHVSLLLSGLPGHVPRGSTLQTDGADSSNAASEDMSTP